MFQLISQTEAKARFEDNQNKLYMDLINTINDHLASHYSETGVIAIPLAIPEVFLDRIKKLFAESKDWTLIHILGNSITVKARSNA